MEKVLLLRVYSLHQTYRVYKNRCTASLMAMNVTLNLHDSSFLSFLVVNELLLLPLVRTNELFHYPKPIAYKHYE